MMLPAIEVTNNGVDTAPVEAEQPLTWGDLTVRKVKTLILPPEYGGKKIKFTTLPWDKLIAFRAAAGAGTPNYDQNKFTGLVFREIMVEPRVTDADMRVIGKVDASIVGRIIDECIKPESLKVQETTGESSPG